METEELRLIRHDDERFTLEEMGTITKRKGVSLLNYDFTEITKEIKNYPIPSSSSRTETKKIGIITTLEPNKILRKFVRKLESIDLWIKAGESWGSQGTV